MKIINYTDITPVFIDNEKARGIAGRVAIGKNDNAENFCMRIFEISAGGNTPMHSHEWEHEIFFHSGIGEVYLDGKWNSVIPGSAVFIPGKEEHQIKNSGDDKLVFVCIIPSGVPEL
jgi:quercetin dioxygenase-like cupin family protein